MYDYRIPTVRGSDLPASIAQRDRGEHVVSHVIDHVKEPAPNFVGMSRLIKANLQGELPPIDVTLLELCR